MGDILPDTSLFLHTSLNPLFRPEVICVREVSGMLAKELSICLQFCFGMLAKELFALGRVRYGLLGLCDGVAKAPESP